MFLLERDATAGTQPVRGKKKEALGVLFFPRIARNRENGSEQPRPGTELACAQVPVSRREDGRPCPDVY